MKDRARADRGDCASAADRAQSAVQFLLYARSAQCEPVIAYIDQGGLSLPDRDYYIKDDARMTEMRNHLVEYATQLFILDGQSPKQAADSAQTVLRIETALAKASMDRTARRDPKNRDHKMTRDEAIALAPNFHLEPISPTGRAEFLRA